MKANGDVAMFFADGELRQTQLDAGAENLAPARALLDASGVPYTATVQVGPVRRPSRALPGSWAATASSWDAKTSGWGGASSAPSRSRCATC